jgi:hypothetical protein
LVGACSGVGEEERRAGEGLVRCRILWGSSGWAVIGAGDGRQGGEKGQLNGWSNGGSVSGMFKHLNLRFKGDNDCGLLEEGWGLQVRRTRWPE